MIPMSKPYCHECEHSELRAAGPLLCTKQQFVQLTKQARCETGFCGPEATFFEQREEEIGV